MKQKILLLEIAALGYNFYMSRRREGSFGGLAVKPLKAVFPALTSVAQATMRTAALPKDHGIVANGFFFKELGRPLFWEQNSGLMEGARIWDDLRAKGGTVGQMFIQQSLGGDSDVILSPAPIHKHNGGMFMDCYSAPRTLYGRLKKELGEFPLYRYWGPLASSTSSRWIACAVESVMASEKPDLLFAYLPHLDYDLQRHGPNSPQGKKAFEVVDELVGTIVRAAKTSGYEVILFGDYAITAAAGVIYPNRIFKEKALFSVRRIKKMEYPDFYSSGAFCLCDHQVAHVHIWDTEKKDEIKELLGAVGGVDRVLDSNEKTDLGIDHARSGDLALMAKPGFWFDYRWWDASSRAPEYATHVDIHQKPGYDPCELFFGFPPSVSQNPLRVKGTHGRADDTEPIAYASTITLQAQPATLLDLAKTIKEIL